MAIILDGVVSGPTGYLNGAQVDAWAASRFTSIPAAGDPPPAGQPDAGPVLSGTTYGGPGQWRMEVPAIAAYYVRVTYPVGATNAKSYWAYDDSLVLTTGAQGAQGVQGYQGTQGTQGYQGSQGVQGAQGNVGFTGPQGFQGAQGYQGNMGSQGVQGTQGTQGTQGFQGYQGLTGPQGAPSTVQGPQGYQGFQGLTGPQGNQGTIGNTGAQGPQGYQGLTGPQGTQGYQGVMGNQGSQGYQGDTGPQGAQGNQGTQGATGAQGTQGFQGTQGTQGFQGTQGSTGSQGPQGYQGYQGTQGSYPSTLTANLNANSYRITGLSTSPGASTDAATITMTGDVFPLTGLFNYLAWTNDPNLVTGTSLMTVGTVYYSAIYVPYTMNISNITVYISVAGALLTSSYVGLYNSTTQIGVSSAITTSWQSTGAKTHALTATSAGSLTNVAPGIYWVAFLVGNGSTTSPTFFRAAGTTANFTNVGLSATLSTLTIRAATGGTGQTALPGSIGLNAVVSQSFWASLS